MTAERQKVDDATINMLIDQAVAEWPAYLGEYVTNNANPPSAPGASHCEKIWYQWLDGRDRETFERGCVGRILHGLRARMEGE